MKRNECREKKAAATTTTTAHNTLHTSNTIMKKKCASKRQEMVCAQRNLNLKLKKETTNNVDKKEYTTIIIDVKESIYRAEIKKTRRIRNSKVNVKEEVGEETERYFDRLAMEPKPTPEPEPEPQAACVKEIYTS